MRISQLTVISMLTMMVGLAAGCATSPRIQAQEGLTRLSPGLSKAETIAIMGSGTVRHGPIQVARPYRTEGYRVGDKFLEVLFYWTDVRTQEWVILEDELTPLIFVDGKLDGWGWGYWQDTVQKFEIRVR